MTVVTAPSVFQCGVTVIAAPRYRLRWSDGIRHNSAVATTDTCNNLLSQYVREKSLTASFTCMEGSLDIPGQDLATPCATQIPATGCGTEEPRQEHEGCTQRATLLPRYRQFVNHYSASEAAQWLTKEMTQHQSRGLGRLEVDWLHPDLQLVSSQRTMNN